MCIDTHICIYIYVYRHISLYFCYIWRLFAAFLRLCRDQWQVLAGTGPLREGEVPARRAPPSERHSMRGCATTGGPRRDNSKGNANRCIGPYLIPMGYIIKFQLV